MRTLPQIFGCMVFNDAVMSEYLPEDAYNAMKRTIDDGKRLDESTANVIANAMKDWAISNGVTHYTHWFQPMTGKTAEKHDSFINPTGNGVAVMEFSGKELIKGEPDASSFPSGGLRYTAEARGYTSWDPTSYAFIKDKTLYIPTAFCSYNGEALDKKTPLLRSMEAINKQALRVLKCIGNTEATSVKPSTGPEQEYFLTDIDYYDARKDLILCGRTLFGAKPPKTQELEDHYFSPMKPRVVEFLQELDEELWKLGIPAKTEHSETAPAQHEMATVYSSANIATDHNQIIMDLLPKIAKKHGLACLLHEKPFAGINGSGKHNNWSLTTDLGENLFEPGDNPAENLNFLVFTTAFLEAVDTHQDLLRVACASAGNDHRLGAAEAPPAIMSIHLGEDITGVLEDYASGIKTEMVEKAVLKVGVHTTPRFMKDPTDRNRTSPMAFTGNKFEFRMVGSSFSVSGPNIILNTIMADALSNIADALEQGADVHALLKEKIEKHKRIIFNGNGYSEAWVNEAAKRGLLNLKTTPEALPYFINEKNIDLFHKFKVFTAGEAYSRYEIWVDIYAKTVGIEATTMLEMVTKSILPAVNDYLRDLADSILAQKQAVGASTYAQESILKRISALSENLYKKTEEIEQKVIQAKTINEPLKKAEFMRDEILLTMNEMRLVVDELEKQMAEDYWPYPTYTDMLFVW